MDCDLARRFYDVFLALGHRQQLADRKEINSRRSEVNSRALGPAKISQLLFLWQTHWTCSLESAHTVFCELRNCLESRSLIHFTSCNCCCCCCSGQHSRNFCQGALLSLICALRQLSQLAPYMWTMRKEFHESQLNVTWEWKNIFVLLKSHGSQSWREVSLLIRPTTRLNLSSVTRSTQIYSYLIDIPLCSHYRLSRLCHAISAAIILPLGSFLTTLHSTVRFSSVFRYSKVSRVDEIIGRVVVIVIVWRPVKIESKDKQARRNRCENGYDNNWTLFNAQLLETSSNIHWMLTDFSCVKHLHLNFNRISSPLVYACLCIKEEINFFDTQLNSFLSYQSAASRGGEIVRVGRGTFFIHHSVSTDDVVLFDNWKLPMRHTTGEGCDAMKISVFTVHFSGALFLFNVLKLKRLLKQEKISIWVMLMGFKFSCHLSWWNFSPTFQGVSGAQRKIETFYNTSEKNEQLREFGEIASGNRGVNKF